MKGYRFIGGSCRNPQGRFAKLSKCGGRKSTKVTTEVHFDGVHCRDSQGAFVPVRQCTGKRKRSKGEA